MKMKHKNSKNLVHKRQSLLMKTIILSMLICILIIPIYVHGEELSKEFKGAINVNDRYFIFDGKGITSGRYGEIIALFEAHGAKELEKHRDRVKKLRDEEQQCIRENSSQ